MTDTTNARNSCPEVRFRYLAYIQKGTSPSSNMDSHSNTGRVPYLTMGYLRGESVEPNLVPLSPSLLFAANEAILLLWDGSNAGEFLRAKQGVVSSTLALVTPRLVDQTYFYWACKSQEHKIRSETVGMGIPHVDGEVLANIRIRLPSLNQQRAIADYLNRETARLDALVAAKGRVLTLLAEKRRALITSAVTRGLNFRGSFRNSGIPWLCRIPEHWEVWKLGHCALIGNGSTPSRSNEEYWADGAVPWLNSSIVNQSEATKAGQFVTDIALRECHLPLVKSGSVLIAITGQGKTRGQAVVLSFDATINQHLAYISPDRSRLCPWFLRWTLLSAYEFLRSISDDTGGTKGALTCEDIANLRVLIPPIDEQCTIVAHITNEISRLDRFQAATERTKALLKERRAALICAAISGQIDVECAA